MTCGCSGIKPPVLVPPDPAKVRGRKAHSTSHVFSDSQVVNMGTLLNLSMLGNGAVHQVDIDVRASSLGVPLVRGNGVDLLLEGDSRCWSGADFGLGELGAATAFALSLNMGDVVVINWVEIKQV